MSTPKPPYRRYMTPALPRESLAPVSGPAPELVLDPEEPPPPTKVACVACSSCSVCRGRHVVPCPECGADTMSCFACDTCPLCDGTRMITVEQAAAYERGRS